MSQNTNYNLANQSGANFRAELNNTLLDIVSNNSGATEPATMFAYELWVDTSSSVMKIRNSGNDAWITLPFSIGADNTVDINGGTVNGISSLSFSSGSTVTSILDEDNLASNSATALATQQSLKTYIDSQVTAQDLDFQADSGGVLSIDLDSETFTLNGGTGITTAGAENTVTFAIDSTVATLTGSQTLTNKSLDLDNNTLTNLEVDNLKAGVLDTDLNAVSGSDNTLASAKAIKTYVDAAITAEDLDISDGTNSGSIDLDSETLGLLGGTGVTSALSGNNITFAIGQAVGTSDNVTFGVVTAALTGNVTGQVSDISNHSTSTLSEGSNLYFTDARSFTAFDTRLATKDTDDLAEGSSNIYFTDSRSFSAFDTRLATKDTGNLTEGSNLYFTNERTDDRISALIQNGTGLTWVYDDAAGTLTGTVSISTFNTSQLSESGNLYYTDARSRAAISENSAQLSYDSSTGVLTYAQGNSDTVAEGSANLFYTSSRANSDIDSRVTKTFIDNLGVVSSSTTGNSATATALATARAFSITGDATAAAQNFDGSGNLTLSLTIDDDAIALGTKTTGNYVATIAGTANEIEVSGSGSETAAVTIGLPSDVSIANDLTVAGSLSVNGSLTYLDTTNLKIEDNLFELNANLTGTPVNDSGMLINRGSADNAVFIWDESADKFTLGLTTADGSATGNITLASLGTLVANVEGAITGNVTGQVSTLSNHDTDDLSEGSSNLYFTNARARSVISASGDISYNSSTGVISFTASASPVVSVNSQTGSVVLDTDDISEGTSNLYFSNAKARAAISEGSTQLAYNSTTGVLTYSQGNSDTVAEGSTNLYFTDTRVATKIDSYVDKAFVDNLSVVAASATGNAGSATTLQTARTIAGVSFDGSANISLNTSNITEDSGYLYFTDARAEAVSINNVVEDTTPQLGGNLDLNSSDITGTGDISITGAITASGAITGTLATAAQPNITSVGTLAGFTSTGIDDNATSTAITIDSSERVLIGTTAIDNNAKLHIEDSAYPVINLDRSSSLDDGYHIGYINFQNNGDIYGRVAVYAEDASETDGVIHFQTQKATTLATKMVITSDGNVGIGTSSPSEDLHVSGTSDKNIAVESTNTGAGANAGIKILSADGGDFLWQTGNATGNALRLYDLNANAERMRIDSSGNVLVGKTALDNSTVGIRMNSTGDASFVANGNRSLVLNRKTSDGDLAIFLKDGSTVGSIGTANSGDLYIGNDDTTLLFAGGSDAILPRGTAGAARDGAISLGLSSHRFNNLHLSGTANVANVTSTSQIKVTGSNASTVAYSVGDTNTGLFNTGSNSIGVSTNGSERMRVNSSGNLGIGTTSPSAPLDVVTSSDVYAAEFIQSKTSNGDGVLISIGSTAASEYALTVRSNAGNTPVLSCKGDGNVGIGTFTPAAKLDLVIDTDKRLTFTGGISEIGSVAGFQSVNSAGSALKPFGIRAEDIRFATGSEERMRIDSSGTFTAKKGMIVTTDDAAISTVGFNQYNNGAWINSPANTYGYLAMGGNAVTRWASSEFHVFGALSKSSGSFRISHPLPSKTDTHNLVHSFVEAPQADNIYRGVVDLVDGSATINIDTVSRMTEGTYVLLNTNTSCFTSNETDWDAVKGSVLGNILTISCQNTSSTATVSWLVIGERHDQHMKDTNWTDENGRVIVEPLKSEEIPQVNLENE